MPVAGQAAGFATDCFWPMALVRKRPLPWRGPSGWSRERALPRVNTTPASASAASDIGPDLEAEETRFRDLALQVRTDRATRLLGEGGLSVTQVAYRLGYADVASFVRCYSGNS